MSAGGSDAGRACSPGDSTACYTGPKSTMNVAGCKPGIQHCADDGSAWGPCEDQVLPTPETCATPFDDDCNGLVNEGGEGCACEPGSTTSCYSGPAATLGVGVCVGGVQTCTPEGTGYGPCEGEITPGVESCTSSDDDDCDGLVNEQSDGCACSPGETADCYSGAPSTLGVGPCVGGTHVCEPDGLSFGPCAGEITPALETCLTGDDDDCDGSVNEEGDGCVCAPGSTKACYSGPPATEGVAACTAGLKTCNAMGTGFGPCVGAVLPQSENCATPADEDCDGQSLACAPGETEWSRTFGDVWPNLASAVAADAAGNVVVAGIFAGALVRKLDAFGNDVWSKQYPGAVAEAVATGPLGEVVLAGTFAGTVDLGGGPLQGGFGAMFLLELAADGSHLWSKAFVASGTPHGVAVDGDGSVALAGEFSSTIDFGGAPLTSVGFVDGFVAKLDPNGAHVWSKAIGGLTHQSARAVAFDGGGAVVVTGSASGTIDVGGGPLVSGGGYDVFVAKWTPLGVHLWSQRFGAAGDEIGWAIASRPDGGTAITGRFQDTIDFGGGPIASSGYEDAFLAVFDGAGNHVWSKSFGAGGTARARGVAVDAIGRVEVTGMFRGSVDFGGGTLTAGDYEDDVYLAKFDASGSYLSASQFGDGANQYGLAVAFDGGGHALLAGRFWGAINLGNGWLFSTGDSDGFVARFAP